MGKMMDRQIRKLYIKLFVIIGLCILCLGTWCFLLARVAKARKAEIAGKPSPEQTPLVTAPVSTEPVPEDSPALEASPEATEDIAETEIPQKDISSVNTTDVTSLQYVANKTHLIDSHYVPADLIEPSVARIPGQKLRKEAAEALEEMFSAAEKDGVSLFFISGYRSYTEQTYLWNLYKSRNSASYVERIDAYPGASEHQLGLSVDLGETSRKCELDACFANSNAYSWLFSHAYEYGYIERYPKDQERETGIMYSPWSFRYIGKEEARKVNASGLSLEAYYEIDE